MNWSRVLVAVGAPAIALELAFPVPPIFMTVYNEPESAFASLVLTLVLTALPGTALALLVRGRWPFTAGAVLSVAAAVVVAVQIAGTDDGQAGLAALSLPIYMVVAAAISLGADTIQRSMERSRVGRTRL